ncbi:hypothetical protein HDU99_003538 [Rhizoclosmatium hyalinum]|nr:hypothetical protein HDU99_003538 [Rhizoclosmatium hyalinum]
MGPPKRKLPQWAFGVFVYSDNRKEGVSIRLLKIFETKIGAFGYCDDLIRDAKNKRINEADDEEEEEELALRFAKPDFVNADRNVYDKYAHGFEDFFAARYVVQRVEVDQDN